MQRRQFLTSAAAGLPLLLGSAGRLYALPVSGPRLLVVFLRGAYDAANIVIPVSSDFYYAARPTLAIARTAALALDGDWGLHPALRELEHRFLDAWIVRQPEGGDIEPFGTVRRVPGRGSAAGEVHCA